MGKWVNTKGPWLNGIVEKSEPVVKEEPKITEEISTKFGRTVVFIRPKCPGCGNKKAKWNGTDGDIRYYECKCGIKFKAFEREL
jgi:DNA-directed RNA polymerase subunit M/transcription elongation factor TFIIS